MKTYTDADIKRRLQEDVEKHGGSINAYARKHKLERSTLHFLLNGTRKTAPRSLLKLYGYEPCYREKI